MSAYFFPTYRSSAASSTAETVVPSRAAFFCAAFQRSSGARRFLSGVGMSGPAALDNAPTTKLGPESGNGVATVKADVSGGALCGLPAGAERNVGLVDGGEVAGVHFVSLGPLACTYSLHPVPTVVNPAMQETSGGVA